MATAWDLRLARRAALLALLGALLILLVVATTDDGAPWPTRVGMVAALLPISGSLGTIFALRIAEGRGELRALAAIGVDPVRAGRGAVHGGVVLGVIGPTLAASGLCDLNGLFPRTFAPHVWIADGSGMLETTNGVRLAPGGVLSFLAPVARWPAPSEPPVMFTVAALLLVALFGPLWSAAPRRQASRLAAALLLLLSALVAFQGVAAGRLPSAALIAAPLILAIDGVRACAIARRS